MEKLALNDDLTISKGSKKIAAYSVETGELRILRGHGGNKKGALIKLLGEADLDVTKSTTVKELITEEAKADLEAKKPTPAKKAAAKKTVAKKTVTERPDDSEEDDQDEEISTLKAKIDAHEAHLEEMSEKDREIAELKSKLKQMERERDEGNFAPGIDIPKGGRTDEDGNRIPPKKLVRLYGPETDPSMGDKTPRVIQWAKEQLSDEEFAEVYGHRVIPD